MFILYFLLFIPLFLFTIFAECYINSKIILNKWKNGHIYDSVIISNIVSTMWGYFFPWLIYSISSNMNEIVFIIVCLISIFAVEFGIYWWVLDKEYRLKKSIYAFLIANVISSIIFYFCGGYLGNQLSC